MDLIPEYTQSSRNIDINANKNRKGYFDLILKGVLSDVVGGHRIPRKMIVEVVMLVFACVPS